MRNEVLYVDRKIRGMSQKEYAKFLGIPYKTYLSYEYCERIPRRKYAQTIITKLGLKDGLVFFPHLHIDDEMDKNNDEKIIKRICDQMNAMSNKKYYDLYMTTMIAKAVRSESLMRKFRKSKINGRTQEGKIFIDKEVASIANKLLKKSSITADDVALYKRCKSSEYENRTGKSTWGIPSARQHYGFDPSTGKEVKEV